MSVVSYATSRRESGQLPLYALLALLATALGIAIVLLGTKALVLAVGAGVFVAFVRRPVWGFYATAASVILSGHAGILAQDAVPITISKLVGVAAVAAWLLNVVSTGKKPTLSWGLLLPLALLFWLMVSTAISVEPTRLMPQWLRIAYLVVFYIMGVELLDSRTKIRHFIILLVLSGLAASIMAMVQYWVPALHVSTEEMATQAAGQYSGAFIDPESLTGAAAVRVSGTFGHSNWLAMGLLLLIPFNVYLFMTTTSRKVRLFVALVLVCELVALVLTFTRTGFVVAIAILLLLGARRMIRVTPPRIVAALLLVALGFMLLPEPYKERVLSIGQYTGSRSVKYRMELQTAAWEIWQEDPFIGKGVGGYGLGLREMRHATMADLMNIWERYLKWDATDMGAHNLYLQTLVEGGVVGLALLLLFYSFVMVRLHRFRAQMREAGDQRAVVLCTCIEISLISFLICGVFLHALQQKVGWMIWTLAAATPLYYAQPLNADEPHSGDGDDNEGVAA